MSDKKKRTRFFLITHHSSLITSPYWKFDREGRAAAGFALDRNRAVVVFDRLARDGEAEARARLLRRVVGLENLVYVFGVDSRTRVRDGDARAPVFGRESDGQTPAAPALHRLHAVNDKVCEEGT